MKTLTELSSELGKRRRYLALNQTDMLMKVGMSQQQYQRVEAGSDMRVSTLLRILEGMGLELMLAPQERVRQLEKILSSDDYDNVLLPAEVDWQDEVKESAWSSVLSELEDE